MPKTLKIIFIAAFFVYSIPQVHGFDWPLPRCNPEATGATLELLPDELEIAWEFKAKTQSGSTQPKTVLPAGRLLITIYL
jgi:hypothetical protein